MRAKITGNIMAATDFEISALGIIPEICVLQNVRVSYAKSAEGSKTDVIESVRYDCVCPETFATFTVKVVSAKKPLVTSEFLEESESPVYVTFPLSETRIKPYAVEFGKAKVTITAPSISFAEV